MRTALRLHEAISLVCPIHGVSIASTAATTARIDYDPTATAAQITAAKAALAAFDWSDAAQTAWELAILENHWHRILLQQNAIRAPMGMAALTSL